MATNANDRSDSDLYEDTVAMPVSGTTEPPTSQVNNIYEPLRIEEGKLSQVHTAKTRAGKCGERRWWIVGAVVIALMCIGLSFVGARLIELEKEMTELKKMMTESEKQMKAIQTEQTEIASIQHKKTVAFSVYLSGSSYKLAAHAVVPFDRVRTDSMGGFDKNEHHYTCQITGTYFFSLCINNGETGDGYSTISQVYLEVGETRIMEIYSRNDDNDHFIREQACNAAVYKCSTGSTVIAKCNYESQIIGTQNQPVSILSGFLIYPE